MEKIVIGKKFDTKYDFRETCFGIYEKDGKILLCKKDNQYSLIGGGIEVGESREDCLKREFLEEAGYNISSIEELVVIDCFWLAAGKYPLESLANIFTIEINQQTKQKPLEDNIEIEFVDIDKVEDLLPLPYHRKAIEYYKKKYK